MERGACAADCKKMKQRHHSSEKMAKLYHSIQPLETKQTLLQYIFFDSVRINMWRGTRLASSGCNRIVHH